MRYEVGNTCPDTNGQYCNIWDNKLQKNATWAHINNVYEEVRIMNSNDKRDGDT